MSELRETFDSASLEYDAIRPGYPEALFDDLVHLAGLRPGDRVLEIGPGTGQASVPLARRGLQVTGIELGANLAAVARARLAPYPACRIMVADFERTEFQAGAYDLVASATAFHWLSPSVSYPRVARSLRPGGHLALWWSHHVRGDNDTGFFEAAQAVYRAVIPDVARAYPGLSDPDGVSVRTAEIARTNLFGPVTLRRYSWDVSYSAESYTRLLGTYSDHIALSVDKRERLFDGLRQLINTSFDGVVVKTYLSILHVTERIG